MSADFVMNAENKDRVIARVVGFLHSWPAEKPCHIRCERFVIGRTNKQNAALFGLAYKILRDETGHELDELHDFFCRRFFGVHEFEVLGEKHTRPMRTTTTDENGKHDIIPWDRFSEFFESVRTFAASELMIAIPDPDPEYWRHKDVA